MRQSSAVFDMRPYLYIFMYITSIVLGREEYHAVAVDLEHDVYKQVEEVVDAFLMPQEVEMKYVKNVLTKVCIY